MTNRPSTVSPSALASRRSAHTCGALSKTKSPAIDKTLRRLSSGAGRRVLNKRPILLRCRRLQFKLKRKCIIPRQSGAVLRPRPGVKSTKIAKRRTYIYTYRYAGFAGCTRRDDTHPEFTSLMYVLDGDRSLSHELLIVRRHNSPRVSHPLSMPLSPPAVPPPSRIPAHSSLLCTSALEIRACARSPAVTNEYVLLRAEFIPRDISNSPLFYRRSSRTILNYRFTHIYSQT